MINKICKHLGHIPTNKSNTINVELGECLLCKNAIWRHKNPIKHMKNNWRIMGKGNYE